ncbi:MAG: hypothetical protein QGI68_13940 [Pseudomonadales bacterium]|nr:hypothetical protein [Pseudomonadales bacterium]MDP7596648.1 hypothetical protein [Pseudomonadales bacterium]HJN49274.1 hypothetical protein [Pseudomonadales bacterium]
MRKWLTVSAILALLVVLFVLVSADEELVPEVAAWLASPPERPMDVDNGYIYFIGILAREQDDPLQVGLQAIGSLAERRREPVFFISSESEEYPPSRRLDLPRGDPLCVIGSPGCLEHMLLQSDKLETLIDSNLVLLDRYRSFLRHSHYTTLTESSADDIDIPYNAITRVNRLLHVSAVKQLIDGNHRKFAATLIDDITAKRSLLGKADDFILKMTLISALAEDFRLISQLYSKGLYGQGLIDPDDKIFADFSKSERSWELAMKRRFNRHADKVYKFFDGLDLSEDGINPLAWPVALLHKPNKTLNDIYPKFHRNYQLSIMSPSQFMDSSRNPADESNIFTRSNIIGSILNRKAMVSYQGYIVVMKDIECFIKLVKIRLSLPAEITGNSIDFDQLANSVDIRNPYNGKRPFIAAQSDRFCFSSRPSRNGLDRLCVDI